MPRPQLDAGLAAKQATKLRLTLQTTTPEGKILVRIAVPETTTVKHLCKKAIKALQPLVPRIEVTVHGLATANHKPRLLPESDVKAAFGNNSIVFVAPPPIRLGKQFTIFCRLQRGNTLGLTIDSLDTIKMVKRQINNKAGIAVDELRLIYAGKQLEDNCTAEDYGLEKDCTIHQVLRLRGGMMTNESGKADFDLLQPSPGDEGDESDESDERYDTSSGLDMDSSSDED